MPKKLVLMPFVLEHSGRSGSQVEVSMPLSFFFLSSRSCPRAAGMGLWCLMVLLAV